LPTSGADRTGRLKVIVAAFAACDNANDAAVLAISSLRFMGSPSR
jgi:hypothetical protein